MTKMTFAIALSICFFTLSSMDAMATKPTNDIDKHNINLLHKARLKTAKGEIVFQFNEAKAPKTSRRIKTLIKKGFYNGIVFHRVVPGFVIQAGDPTATGQGGSGKKLMAEFNDERHVPGTVAMARKGNDINSADSQFYISLGTHSHLDGKYTIFGKVIKGLDVAKKISQGEKIIKMTLE